MGTKKENSSNEGKSDERKGKKAEKAEKNRYCSVCLSFPIQS